MVSGVSAESQQLSALHHMSNPMERCPSIDSKKTVETTIGEATRLADSYDTISVLSIYWKSDDTGCAEDSSLFVQTLSKLHNVRTRQRALVDNDRLFSVGAEVERAASLGNLFILHYAGHATAGSTPESLITTPKIDQEPGNGPELNLTIIKDELKNLKSSGLDVLFVIDCIVHATKGQGKNVRGRGAKVEVMAGTAQKGLSNSEGAGRTFTQHWCQAFTTLLEVGNAFTCDDIVRHVTTESEQERVPSTFVLREGSDLPITFYRNPDTIDSALPVAGEPSRKGGTLLLLRMPVELQEMLGIPNVVLTKV